MKLDEVRACATLDESLPVWERGLKLYWMEDDNIPGQSLPAWERGLKQEDKEAEEDCGASLPAWERGLKLSV